MYSPPLPIHGTPGSSFPTPPLSWSPQIMAENPPRPWRTGSRSKTTQWTPVNPAGKKNAYSAYPTSNYPYRQGKTWVYEGGLKIPLIVYVPGLTAPGSSSDAFVHGADFFASFVDMAGAPQQSTATASTDSSSFMLSAGTTRRQCPRGAVSFFHQRQQGYGQTRPSLRIAKETLNCSTSWSSAGLNSIT